MPSRRILIIDDEENIGRSLRMILEREGYQVNVVNSAAEMRAFPDRGRIDLFLSRCSRGHPCRSLRFS
jgi:DNA-binding NtrC family response regulator